MNPFEQDDEKSNPFDSPDEQLDDNEILHIPTIPAPVPRITRDTGSPPTSSNSSRTIAPRRIAAPSNGRYLSPYTTPGVSRRSSMTSRRLSVSTVTSQHELFWTGRHEGPYAFEHDAQSSSELNTQTVTEKFDIGPTTNLLWDPSYVEDDDDLHDPTKDNPKRDTNIWTKRGLINLGALVLLVVGLLVLFIAIPAITFWRASHTTCTGDQCLDVGPRALLTKPRTNLVDPDTPASAKTKKDSSGKTLQLVFSDEFNQDGRTFYPGDDQFFEGMDFWYGVTQDLECMAHYDSLSDETNHFRVRSRCSYYQRRLYGTKARCFREPQFELPQRYGTVLEQVVLQRRNDRSQSAIARSWRCLWTLACRLDDGQSWACRL